MHPTIVKTADGSHSLFVAELDEHYHSIHGAIQESKHVFIEAGLKQFISPLLVPHSTAGNSLNILEIGFGTGLNTLLTFIEAEKISTIIDYSAIEAYPVSPDLIKQLNYVELLGAKNNRIFFDRMHSCEWEKPLELVNQFIFCKIKNTLQNIVLESKYNLIYFDAFGPRVQPEMWREDVFAKLFAATRSNGYLVTYCAKGEVKRTLKRVGYSVESLPGPPGKREMVRARKN